MFSPLFLLCLLLTTSGATRIKGNKTRQLQRKWVPKIGGALHPAPVSNPPSLALPDADAAWMRTLLADSPHKRFFADGELNDLLPPPPSTDGPDINPADSSTWIIKEIFDRTVQTGRRLYSWLLKEHEGVGKTLVLTVGQSPALHGIVMKEWSGVYDPERVEILSVPISGIGKAIKEIRVDGGETGVTLISCLGQWSQQVQEPQSVGEDLNVGSRGRWLASQCASSEVDQFLRNSWGRSEVFLHKLAQASKIIALDFVIGGFSGVMLNYLFERLCILLSHDHEDLGASTLCRGGPGRGPGGSPPEKAPKAAPAPSSAPSTTTSSGGGLHWIMLRDPILSRCSEACVTPTVFRGLLDLLPCVDAKMMWIPEAVAGGDGSHDHDGAIVQKGMMAISEGFPRMVRQVFISRGAEPIDSELEYLSVEGGMDAELLLGLKRAVRETHVVLDGRGPREGRVGGA